MRTRLRDDLHALRRPGAVAALVAALCGVVAIRSTHTAAWSLVATVDALGTADASTVAVLTAVESTTLAWVSTLVGAVVVVASLLLAIDRPPPVVERLLYASSVALVVVAGIVVGTRPTPGEFAARGLAADLVDTGAALPTGVSIELTVEMAAAPVLLAVAALLIALCTWSSARRG